MAKRGERICFVDWTKYRYCPSCGGNPDETWRFLFCSENCRAIEKLWEDYYRDQSISREMALERASKLDLSNVAHFRDQIRLDMFQLVSELKSSMANNAEQTGVSI